MSNVRSERILDRDAVEELVRRAGEDDPLYLLGTGAITLMNELQRARRLAAHLEEVVAMRTAVLEALVGWQGVMRDDGLIVRTSPAAPDSLYAIIDWAKAQLSEVP